MTQPVPLQNVITQLAEGQRHLQIIFKQQIQSAKTERQALQDALKEQATLLTSNQQTQDTAILRLMDVIANARTHPHIPGSVLQKYQDGDDPDYFFTNFERVATTAAWPKERWGQYIAPLLSGELQAAYQAANPAGTTAYDEVKKAILERLGCDQEYYRAKFRKEKWNPGDNPRALYYRIRDLGTRWLAPHISTIEEMLDRVFLEQFLEALPLTTRAWVKQHPHLNPNIAVDLACAYHRAPEFKAGVGRTPITGPRPPPVRIFTRPEQKTGPLPRMGFPRPIPPLPSSHNQGPQCYQCLEWGHIARNCPRNLPPAEPMEIGYSKGRICLVNQGPYQYKRDVFLNGKKRQALLDTGCHVSVVDRTLISPQQLRANEAVNVTCVHGDTKTYPVAEVLLDVSNDPQLRTVGLIPSLPEAIIIGTDHPRFDHYLTEAQKEPNTWLNEAPVNNSEVEGEVGKERKTRSEKRRAKNLYTDTLQHYHAFPLSLTDQMETVPVSFRAAQRDDNTLAHAWEQVQELGQDKVGPYFYAKKGLLYRAYKKEESLVSQLIVPLPFREHVLHLPHSYTGGGHYGKENTLKYLLGKFYWPGVYKDVAKHCAACVRCQYTSPEGVKKAPLYPLPIIDVPFKRVGMDLVGPLTPSARGHKYLLVIVDYASRYPEAFPLTTMTTPAIAKAMINLFSRVGFPTEILTDQGTPFMSRLMAQMCEILGIQRLRTSVYHPQTDGLVERYNKTIKNMLRKVISETGRDWDQKLPLILFAIRTHEQRSTGYSPFEILFGRKARTLLDMASEQWEEEEEEGQPLCKYAAELKSSLSHIWGTVHEHMEKAQTAQKQQYDRNSLLREFQPGDKVLLLLPTTENKLLSKWQGPFVIERKITPVTYSVLQPLRAGGKQIYHVNHLKKWEEPIVSSQTGHSALFVNTTRPLDIPTVQKEKEPSEKAPVGDILSPTQQAQLETALRKFPDLFSSAPGLTSLVQHDIVALENTTIVKQKPYRIPEARRAAVEKEVAAMLQAGIIEPSNSNWCSPIVIVPKPDGSLRFCIDFRQVNNITKFDSYPMPRIDEILERLGKAKYMSTLDLTKGYWQIPLSPQAKEKTAFSTPSGLYHFRVLPFGLHGAPATFQRLMDRLLRSHGTYAAAYLDDIVVFSETWDDHLQHLCAVFSTIQEAGLKINPNKSLLVTDSIHYLGYTIQGGMIKPQVNKVEAITTLSPPKTKKEIRSFLGFIGYYRRFIPGFSSLASPLTTLLTKPYPNRVIRWEQQHEESFQALKAAICTAPVLHCPEFQKPFVLQTDASGVGLGAVLQQPNANGDLCPVLYISRKLFPRETHYSTIEK